jgi:hypothetical protein
MPTSCKLRGDAGPCSPRSIHNDFVERQPLKPFGAMRDIHAGPIRARLPGAELLRNLFLLSLSGALRDSSAS